MNDPLVFSRQKPYRRIGLALGMLLLVGVFLSWQVGVMSAQAAALNPLNGPLAPVATSDPCLVDNTADDGEGSLREVMWDCAVNSTGMVVFDPLLDGSTITVLSPLVTSGETTFNTTALGSGLIVTAASGNVFQFNHQISVYGNKLEVQGGFSSTADMYLDSMTIFEQTSGIALFSGNTTLSSTGAWNFYHVQIANGKSLTGPLNGAMNVYGDWGDSMGINTGEFIPNGSTVHFASYPVGIFTSHVIFGTSIFHNVQVEADSYADPYLGATMTLTGNLLLNGGYFYPDSYAPNTIVFAGSGNTQVYQSVSLSNLRVEEGAVLQFAQGASTQIFGDVSIYGELAHPSGDNVVFGGDWSDGLQTFQGSAIFDDVEITYGISFTLGSGADFGYMGTLVVPSVPFPPNDDIDILSNTPTTVTLAGSGLQDMPFYYVDNLVVKPGATLNASSHFYIFGNFACDGGFVHNGGTVDFSGSPSVFTGSAIFNDVYIAGYSELALGMNANLGYAGTLSGIGTLDLSNAPNTLTLAGTTAQYVTGAVNNLVINPGAILSAPSSLYIWGSFTNNGTFVHNNSTVTFMGAPSYFYGTAVFNHVEIPSTFSLRLGENANFGYQGNVWGIGTMEISTTVPSTLTLAGSAVQTLPVDIDIDTVHSLVINPGATLSPPSLLNIYGNFTNNGDFIHNNGTVVFNGNSHIGGNSETHFNNVVIGGGAGDEFVGSGTLAATAGGVLTAPNGTLYVGGSFTNSGDFDPNNGTIIFTGNTVIGGSSSTQFHNIVISGTGVTGDAFFGAGKLAITAGNAQVTAPPGQMLISGEFTNSGDFDPNNGTVGFNGNSNIGGNSETHFNNVIIGGGVGDEFVGAGSFAITAGGVLTAPNGTLYVGGSFTNSGDFDPNNGTIIFTGNTVIGGSSSTQFHNIVISGTGVTGDAFFGAGKLAITAGNAQVTAPPGQMLISGEFTNSGDFDPNNGTVGFNGNSQIGGLSNTHFNNVVIGGGAGDEFVGAGSFAITAGGVLTAPNGTLFVGGSFTNSGDFDPNNGTIIFTGNTVIGGSSSTQFHNIVISGTGVTGDAFFGAGNLAITAGNAQVTAPPGQMLISGDFTNSGDFDPNNGTVGFNGNSHIGGLSNTHFNNVVITDTAAADAYFAPRSLAVTAMGALYAPPAGTMYVGGDFINYGDFDPNNGTIIFEGTSTVGGSQPTTFVTVIVNPGAQLEVPSGTQIITATVETGALLDIPCDQQLTSLINNDGSLRQTCDTLVDNTRVEFVTEGGYAGLIITPTLSSSLPITATITEGVFCTSDQADSLIQRCFQITPNGAMTATIRFHYEYDELYGQNPLTLKLWHYNGSAWEQVGTNYQYSDACMADHNLPCWFQVEGISSFSPFVIGSGERPMAVRWLPAYARIEQRTPWLALGLTGIALAIWVRRARKPKQR